MNWMLRHWCFWFNTNALMCEAWKTGECMDKKGVMVEEWKARRKEWKKKRWKKGKREKVVLGKVLFVFVWLCLCLFPFFPLHPPHHHTLTLIHHPPHNMTHWCTPSHANRAVCCAAFFGSGQRDTHCIIHTPHSITWHHTTHTNKPNTDTAHGTNNNEMTIAKEKGDWTKGKSGTTQQHQHTDWSGNNTMALKHTGLWLTIEGWVDVADIDNDKVFDTKPSHSHPPHPTTKPPPFHPSSLSNSNPLPSAHSTTLPTPLLLHIVCMPHCHNHTSFDCWRRKKEEGLRASGRKGVAHLSGFFEVTQNHSTLLNNHPHTERQREREKEREKGKRLLRPYQEESTTSRLISEVKPLWAWLVLGLETTWEHQVS